ncbi:hypothetical protein ACF0H5_006120 [Mactra antiquata]
MEIGNSMFSFGILVLFGVMTCGVTGQPDINVLTVVNNELIRLINNCTVGDSDSCFPGHCCTKTVSLYYASSELQTIHGVLIDVVDNCTPGDDSSCSEGHCCVKEGLAYIPEYTGPRPVYRIACNPYRQHGEFCYHQHVTTNTYEVCPCAPTLNCTSNGIFGHCV